MTGLVTSFESSLFSALIIFASLPKCFGLGQCLENSESIWNTQFFHWLPWVSSFAMHGALHHNVLTNVGFSRKCQSGETLTPQSENDMDPCTARMLTYINFLK